MVKTNSASKKSQTPENKQILENKYRFSNLMVSLITALFLFIFDFWSIIHFDFSYSYSLLIVLVSLVMYIVLLSVLSKTSYKRRVNVRTSKNRDEVIKALVKEVEGIEKEQQAQKKGLDGKTIFIGSTDSKMYHRADCRYAKNIKASFRLENNNEQFFKSKNFKACGSCLKKK